VFTHYASSKSRIHLVNARSVFSLIARGTHGKPCQCRHSVDAYKSLTRNLEAIGAFFKALDIPAFGFVDNKNRKAEEIAQMSGSFTSVTQIPYKGAETLIAAETPMDRQWQFLQLVRADDGSASFGIPSKQPVPDELRELTIATLKRLKGEGGGARLLELCSTGELPPTIVGFLKAIYARFPKPKRQLLKAAGSESAGDSPEISSTAAADETHLPLEASAKTKDEPNTAT
jgi:putative ATP-dependent endonuclease of OLD family